MTALTLNQLIWQLVAAIPAGRVATYGQIARQAGYPRHARYVGQTLKSLPSGTELPWHRVVNARGELSFALHSAPYQLQRQRLEAEGVVFHKGRISLRQFGLDEEV